MGVIEDPPSNTEDFYEDGYYGGQDGGDVGYSNYAITAEHTLLWVRLLVAMATNKGATVLDVGCADGFLLDGLPTEHRKLGIEVNERAAVKAAAKGISIIGNDVLNGVISASTVQPLDFITSIATFEHVLDFKGAFEKCLSLLKADGILLFEVPLISETEDNSGWLNASYEHIYYPTASGMKRLLGVSGCFTVGFETKIRGFSSSYLAVATRDRVSFERVSSLLDVMKRESPVDLPPHQAALNIAYNLVHRFEPTPDRVLALPKLFETVGYRPALITLLCQSWYADSVKAANNPWLQQQVDNWQLAYRKLEHDCHVEKVELPKQRVRNALRRWLKQS
jgi:SAM-dependent methyltransferase